MGPIRMYRTCVNLMLLGLALGAGCIGVAKSEQIFPANLPEARGDHTATSLPSGMVLLAGGNDNNGRVASTTLYDPDNKKVKA